MPNTDWYQNPTLKGTKVTLVPMSLDHAEDLLDAASDEAFTHLTYQRPQTVSEMQNVISGFIKRHDDHQCVPYSQIDNVTGKAVGMTTYYDIDPTRQTLAIGSTWLGKKWQRTGINTEAKQLLLHRAFEELDAVRVVWHTDTNNLKSQAAIEKLGATKEGVLRKHRKRKDGSWRDTVQYSMIDTDYFSDLER